MLRRVFLGASASLPLLGAADRAGAADLIPPATPFDGATVRNMARQLATQPYKAPDSNLPADFKNLDVDAYHDIRFDPAKALWRGQGRKFTAQFYPRGYIYQDRVGIFEVADGHATPIGYSNDLFSFGKTQPSTGDLGFAGLSIQYPLNRPDVPDEVCAFLGASYFRAVAKGQGYGISARGLSVRTADAGGEEFPVFRSFWLERPTPGADLMVIHALLDSPSAAASFRFTIRPGEDTVFDTETALYPRVDVTQAGLAPLTSMFLFDDANDHSRFDDWRAAVHDSSGLQIRTGHDEAIWRPLTNPRGLQISTFSDTSPRGFGLMQRKRAFADYQDLEARYEKRPSLWIEPIGDWGQGVVELVEIPSDREVNDNMVAFWRPHDPLRAKGEYLLNYRLHWCWSPPSQVMLAQVVQTRDGFVSDPKHRRFVIDFVGDALKVLKPEAPPALDVGSDKGKIISSIAQPNPDSGGWRISLEIDLQDNKVVEMHARLMNADQPLTETWIYRWTQG
ncbi:glucan biosynthesis protein [Rhodopila sp.]|uniref:glucan biosynthesis protein n=1 Tax=Rhodopila sp. TaxID=2480087 RepID=UPI003D1462F4